MALVLHDRVQETTTTTGTGSVTLDGAALGYQSFSVIGNGNTTFYCIAGQGSSEWEVGIGTYTSSGTTLSRDTVLSSSNSGSLVNFSAGTKAVFVTYPSEKSVNLDSNGNVSALGNVTSGTWQGSTVGVAYGGTGVTSSSGPNSVVLRDSNGNITGVNNVQVGLTAITAAGGTTTLTASSTQVQVLVGSTNQTIKLPDATTLAVGFFFTIANGSSGTLTVQDNAGTVIETIEQGGAAQALCTSIATSAGSWGFRVFAASNVTWGNANLDYSGTITSATWNGEPIPYNYGGTTLNTFGAANNAIYSTSANALTYGTLPVAAGGTGLNDITVGHIPFGNGTSPLQSSSSLEFVSGVLIVGGTAPLGGATNPITAFSSTANNYIQTYIYNASSNATASADLVAYSDNSTDASGWADMGYTSSTYASSDFSVTGPNEAYLFGSAPSGVGASGNLIYATDSTGTDNAHQWYVGGFNQVKSAWKMQLTSTGLQLANALSISNGGTGQTTKAAAFNALSPITSTGDLIIGDGSNSATRLAIGTSGQFLTSNGTSATWADLTGGTSLTNTAFTATSGQTSFSVSYTVGLIEVFRNGVCLVPGTDYTASNGTTVDLASGATAGDSILVVGFSPINVYANITTDYFSGNGSATTFTMSVSPADSSSVLVTVTGVVQDPSSYSVSGTTLTFSSAPPAGTNNITARYLGVQSISTVASFSGGTTGLTPSTATTGAVILGGTLAVANGGTGQTTANAAFNALAPSQTGNSGKYLTTDGSNASWDQINISTADITGTLAVANGGTGVTSSTGSGSVVLSNSPTLVTPALGTPASGNLANCTFPTLNQNTTGSSGSVATTNWTISESGGKLYFAYGGVNKMSLDSSGNFIALGNVTAYGTP